MQQHIPLQQHTEAHNQPWSLCGECNCWLKLLTGIPPELAAAAGQAKAEQVCQGCFQQAGAVPVDRQLGVIFLDFVQRAVTFVSCSSDQQQDVPCSHGLAITLSAGWSCCPAVALDVIVCLTLFEFSCLDTLGRHGRSPTAQSGHSLLPRVGSNVQACSCWYGVPSQRVSQAGSHALECAVDAGSCHVQDNPLVSQHHPTAPTSIKQP